MDPFEDFLDDPSLEVPDIDLDVAFDGSDLMELDCDPDFNNFLRELASEDPCPCCNGADVCETTSSYQKTQLHVVTASGAEDSTSPPRSPSGSSGNESCQYGACSGAKCGTQCQVRDVIGKLSVGRRAKAESEDMRSLRVKERNRLYAARTRQRKNRLLQDLRQRCSDLEAENTLLKSRVMHLQEEVDSLRSSKSCVGAVPRGPGRVAGGLDTSPTPSTNTHYPVSGVLPVKPTAARTAPNQKTKNKLRFTAAAAACPPQDDASTARLQASPPVSTSSHGSDSRGVQSTETFRDKDMTGSYPGSGATKAEDIKQEPQHAATLKRPMECTIGGPARRVRGRGTAATSRSQVPSMATFGVLALAAISCLVLVAFPSISFLSPGAVPVESSGLVAAPRHTRALLADPESSVQRLQRADGLVPYRKWSIDVVHEDEYFIKDDYDDWVGVDDDAHHVLLSAAFVCNHTTCVAVPKGGGSWTRVVPQVPVELRPEDPMSRSSLEATMLSALGGTEIAGRQDTADELLRGSREADDEGTQGACPDGGCGEGRQSTGEALSMAGLLAPQHCELVLRTHGAASTHAVGTEIAQTFSGPASSSAVVEAGGVALLKYVQESADMQSNSQRQQVMIGKSMNSSTNQKIVSVLFPAWKSEVEEAGVLTPMRHMYVLATEGDDLLTYECSLSRALYI